MNFPITVPYKPYQHLVKQKLLTAAPNPTKLCTDYDYTPQSYAQTMTTPHKAMHRL